MAKDKQGYTTFLALNTKRNETHHYSFIPPKLVFYTPCVYLVLEGDIIPQAVFYLPERERWNDDFEKQNMNNFPN